MYYAKLSCIRSVSIHAPTWGATYCHPVSTACEVVSIHAPTWGATVDDDADVQIYNSFNPRAHVGRDYPNSPFNSNLNMFQSTRPRGARPPDISSGYCNPDVSIHAPTSGATMIHRF